MVAEPEAVLATCQASSVGNDSTQSGSHYVLKLFVAGASHLSVRAIGNVQAICAEYLEGRVTLEVVDVHLDAALMLAHNILAAPTLVKEAPLPRRTLVGDLTDTARVLAALDLQVGPRATGSEGR